ncbi:U3 small nucleolar RNA-associated protein 5 [[Candida] railenensis]|uniref:U3 small nucleolar RNA-associated protein 5 n=1 Tax=[Candida] railenensis TaxID=45579 RepID=A0A9P0QPC4_9ASCO|nr:U3 small nucleolar RNA-associated protein 5 [[Candida] railenensis]
MSSSSPLLQSAYDPTNTYLASAIVELDSHKLRVQSINSAQSSLNTAFKLNSKLTSMEWGFFNASSSSSLSNSIENEFIAIGTASGVIQIYAPSSNEIISELINPTNLSISDIHYSTITNTLWTCDYSGQILEWDLSTFSIIHTISINDFLTENLSTEQISKISTIKYANANHLLIATHSVYLYDIANKKLVKAFPAHIQPVNTLLPIPSNPDLFLTSASNDRFINLYSISKVSAVSIFVTQSPVLSVSLGEYNKNHSILTAITEEGVVEVFNNAFSGTNGSVDGTPNRKKRRQIQSKSNNCTIKLTRPIAERKEATDSTLTITTVSVSSDNLIVSWLENASIPYFETISWLDESTGELALVTDKVIEKSKPNTFATTLHSTYGHDIAANKHYNEGNAIVSDGTNLKDVANVSDDEDDEDEDGETLAEKLDKLATNGSKSSKNDQIKKKVNDKKKLGGTTLTIILSQALRNNDHSLLETVLANRDPQVIQNTIAKLDSSLAVTLLDRLAERIARQTSRFDQLNFWLKWIIIIHGGILTSLPNLNSKLSNLHAILSKKADVLPRLLELQGRLNLLYQQMDLKREIVEEDDLIEGKDEESDVEYVEELDDAEFNGDISGDDFDMDGEDDFDMDDEDIDEESDDEDGEEDDIVADVMTLETPEDEEGYSDVEIGVRNDLMNDEDDEEAKESDLRVKKHIKNLKNAKKQLQKK